MSFAKAKQPFPSPNRELSTPPTKARIIPRQPSGRLANPLPVGATPRSPAANAKVQQFALGPNLTVPLQKFEAGPPRQTPGRLSHPRAPQAVAQPKINSFSANAMVAQRVVKDKAYGISGPRSKFLNSIDGQNSNTVDDLNNQFQGTGVLIDKYSNPSVDYPDIGPGGLTPEADLFKQFLEDHPRYDPRKVSAANKTWTRVKRSCKAGIEFAVKNNKTVNFVLDGMDLQHVINKTSPHDQGTQETLDDLWRNTANLNEDDFLPITGSELRYVYRLRKNQEIMSHIVFWRDGGVVPAPWITDPNNWSNYKPKSEAKGRGKLIAGVGVVAAAAIAAFLLWKKGK